MKQIYQLPFSRVRQMLKNGMLIAALLAVSMGYSQNEDTIQLGDGEETASYFPIYYLYNYSYSQTIYTAEELYEQGAVEEATSITKIMYKPTTSASTSNWKDWVVYIGNTSKESFDESADWIAVADMSEVFDGQLQDDVTAGEWVEITLDASFEWDGTSNIVIAVDQNTADYFGNPNWAGYTLEPESGSKGICFYADSTNPDPDNPATEGSFLTVQNQVAQIQLVGEFLVTCGNMPTAGTVEEDDFSVCAGNDFDLSVSGASSPANGLERIWQSSPADEDDWTDIDGATTSTYTVQIGIEEPTDFRYQVTCNNSDETDTSDIIEVNLNPGNECFCTPIYTTGCSTSKITNVSLMGESESFDNDSECSDDAYGDYTDLTSADLAPGETYTLSVSTDSSSPTYEQVRAWIDYNKDGQFSDDEEIANTDGNGLVWGTQAFDFTVPEGLGADEYRMRVRLVYSITDSSFDPCGSQNDGETEDYTVETIQLEDCEGTPTAGTLDDEDFSVCAGNPFSLSISGASDPANGLERIWQSSPAGEDDWIDIDGAALNTYSAVDGIVEPTDFRYKVTCNNSNESDISDVITVTLNPGDECFCTPEGGGDNEDEIVNFTLVNLDNDSESGSSTSGYSDFTDSVDPAELIPGQSYAASLKSGAGSGNHGAAIWIDYNDNGFFEVEERVTALGIIISSYETITFPEFTVANSPGMHRLRVQYTYGKHGEDLDPCQVSNPYNETEDYMVNIVEGNCPTPSDVSVDVENTTVVVDWTENGSASEWELIYGAPGFNLETDGTTVTVQEKPAAISDLDPETGYEVYAIAICDDENSSVPSDSKAFTTGELSVNNPLFENFTYYPNPVKGQLTLKAGMQIENVKVYNLLGQNVLSSKPNTLQTQLNTERLQSGIYLMKVTIDGNTKIFRLIKR